MRRNHNPGQPVLCRAVSLHRRGVATLWMILAIPVVLVALCFAIESARLWLMRQQLIVSVESAALSAVIEMDGSLGVSGTLGARRSAAAFAAVNTVDGDPVPLALNYDPADVPNENADCDGDILLGTILERSGQRVFNAGLPGGCGDAVSGPKAVSLMRRSAGGWQTVRMCNRSYSAMVVVATPNYTELSTPAVVRIRNVTADSFDFFLQSTNTGAPVASVAIHFLIVEAGRYTVAGDGVRMEAVRYLSTATDRAPNSWNGESRSYLNSYAQPVVIGQVMSFNDPDWSVFWSRGPNRSTPPTPTVLRTGKHVGEDPDTTRAAEVVGYIVIEAGTGTMRGLPFYAQRSPDFVRGMDNSPPYVVGLPGSPTAPGGFAVASQAGMDGNNGSWAVLYDTDPVSDTQLNLVLDEDQLSNAERNHITENVDYVILAGPYAARVRTQITVDYLCTFGCPLTPPTLQAETFSFFDCLRHRARLTKVDRVICPGP